MNVRLAQPEDFAGGGIDRLLAPDHDVRLASDIIVASGPIGRPLGCLVWRPAAFVHALVCGRDLLARKRAVALYDFAVSEGRNMARCPRGILFAVRQDNLRMQNWVENSVKAGKEQGIIYSLPL